MSNMFESMPTVKDVDSPDGRPFHAPISLADLPDCPICQHGTPVDRKSYWICIDCGAMMNDKQVKRKNQTPQI